MDCCNAQAFKIAAMHKHLKFLIKWPDQKTCWENMPQILKDLYLKTRCIIDCTELFIERPCAFQARAQTYILTTRSTTLLKV